MQPWRSRRSSSISSRPPGWQTVSSRSPKNTSRTCGLTDCGLAGGALAAGTLAGGALAGGALAGLEAGTLAAPPAAEENKAASVESGVDQALSGGGNTVRSSSEGPEVPAPLLSGADPALCPFAGARLASRSPQSIYAWAS